MGTHAEHFEKCLSWQRGAGGVRLRGQQGDAAQVPRVLVAVRDVTCMLQVQLGSRRIRRINMYEYETFLDDEDLDSIECSEYMTS